MENSTENKPCQRVCRCVGYAFVPIQILDDVYTPEKALEQGTFFPELDLNINEYGNVCKQGGII